MEPIVKTTYIICTLIMEIFLITLAALSPIYLTPGYYWWTAFGLAMLVSVSVKAHNTV